MCPLRTLLKFTLGTLLLSAAITFLNYIFIDNEEWIYEYVELPELDNSQHEEKEPVFLPPENEARYPIILWWSAFTGYPRNVKTCSEGTCLFTQSRTEQTNPLTAAVMYYGTDVNWNDLPLPREPDVLWALLHEESPKNNWMFAQEKGISLFNLTATCSRYSDYTVVSQFLNFRKLAQPVRVPTSQKSKGGLAPVVYIQSDCDPPSDRDSYVGELMKYIEVDSYGRCLHNKDLPEHLLDTLTFDSEDLYNIVAKYKFTIAFENAICHDYITEKFWRPLYVGSVPIVRGSPTAKDWAPDKEHSIIVADEFPSPKELAEYLKYLDQNDDEYEKYLEFKRSGITNPLLQQHMQEREWVIDNEGLNFIDGFECYVCNEIHRMKRKEAKGQEVSPRIATIDHYNCPIPEPSLELEGKTIAEKLANMNKHARSELEYWRYVARCTKMKANVTWEVIARGGTQEELTKALKDACHEVYYKE